MSEYKYKSLVFDGSSQFMNIHLMGKLQDEYYHSRDLSNKKNVRALAIKTETDFAIYGSMAFQMLSIFLMIRTIGEGNYFIQLYGSTGVGKTASVLASSPEPIMYIDSENRPVSLALDAIEEAEGRRPKCHQEFFDDPDDLREFLNEQINMGAKGLLVTVIALSKTVNKYKKMRDRNGKIMDITDPKFYQILNALEKGGFTDFASYTIPNYEGEKFLKNYPGMLDYIGFVTDRYDSEDNVVFPPLVKFERNEDYLGKWTGARKKRKLEGPLDYRKTFKQ